MVGDRPDRIALWAVFLALSTILIAAMTAQASSGGSTLPGTEDGAQPVVEPAHFGSRVLRAGMSGDDVRVLNGIVKSKSYAERVKLSEVFESPTVGGVKEFQRRKALRVTGVVDKSTAKELTASMPRSLATWYGPGLYGNTTACGQTLRPSTVGVAHKTLPCGTKVTFAHGGRFLVTRVIDRGPFNPGYTWDLTNGAREALGFDGSGDVRHAVAR